MPLQDKHRPDRKQKPRKVICIETGQIFDSVQDFADEYNIVIQTAYNIIRRKQVYHGLTFRYLDRAERTDTSQTETEVQNHD